VSKYFFFFHLRCHFIHSSQEALTHNKNVAAYQARLAQQSRMKSLSMSTGSDRETSSVGSLSPTMTNVQNQSTNCFGDHQSSSPTNIFSYSFSPSNSPILNEMSASISPPPPPMPQQQTTGSGLFVKPTFIDQTAAVHVNVMKQIPEDRLPVFNQISSVIDSMSTFKI
jgi:hypothetical protein